MVRGGIDLGGTHMAAGILAEDGKLLAVAERPTCPGRPAEEMAADLAGVLAEAAEKAGLRPEELASVGIGVPGAANDETGVVTNCNNLGWYHLPLRELMRRYVSLPVHLGNDANAAALAESRYGAGKGTKSCVMITLGTGVGAGIVLDGKVWNGAFGYAGEIGHMCLVPGGVPCTCGRSGCVEQYCSATGLIRMGRRACELFRDTRMLTETGGDLSRLNARMILDCARDGDPRAMTVFQEYVRYLATVIDGMIVLLEPEMIILGGGVSRAGSFLLDAVSAQLPRWEADEKRPDIPVRAACLGNEAGMIGAALLGDA
ncbi:MAG: ROK family protein [Clostridiales bacterium]|nr:ROK family protein [Clostridiales bacterium]